MWECMKKLLWTVASFFGLFWSTIVVEAVQLDVQTYIFATDVEYVIPTLTMVHSLLRYSTGPKRIIFLEAFGTALDPLVQEFFSEGAAEKVKAAARDLIQHSVSGPNVEVLQWDVENIMKGFTEKQRAAFDVFCEDVSGSRFGHNLLVNLRVMYPVCFSNENLKRSDLLPDGWDPNVMYVPHFLVFDSDMLMGEKVDIEGEYARCIAAGLPVMGARCPSMSSIIGGGTIFMNNKVCQQAIQNEWNITKPCTQDHDIDLYALFLSTLYTPPEKQAEQHQNYGVEIDNTRMAEACGYRSLGKPLLPEHEEYCLTKLALQYDFAHQKRTDKFFLDPRFNFLASRCTSHTNVENIILHWDQLIKPWKNILEPVKENIKTHEELTSMLQELLQSDSSDLPSRLWLQNCLNWLDQGPDRGEAFLAWLQGYQRRKEQANKLLDQQDECSSKRSNVRNQIKSLENKDSKDKKTEQDLIKLESRAEVLRQQRQELEKKTNAMEKTPWMFFNIK